MLLLAELIAFPRLGELAGDFRAETALVAGMAATLLYGTFAGRPRRSVAVGLALLSFALAAGMCAGQRAADRPTWDGWLISDGFSLVYRGVAYAAAAVSAVIVLMGADRRTDADEEAGGTELAVLLLGATLGIGLMASAGNLLMVYLAVEMASLPSYILVGFRRTGPAAAQSAEAAVKYAVFGAAASGIMLYGLSVLYALVGSLGLADLAAAAPTITAGPERFLAGMAVVCVLAGLAFKIAAVPAHFWCPDAFTGASAEAAAFLSVASKVGGIALLLRFVAAFADGPFGPALAVGLSVAAVASMTLGNLAAYGQSDVRRLLAYSGIAHVGYMLCGVAAFAVVPSAARAEMSGAVAAYLAAYLLLNLGAFGAAVAVRRTDRSGDEGPTLPDLAGSASRFPAAGVCMAVCVAGLIGLPPAAGFFAKLSLFAAVFSAGRSAEPTVGGWLIAAVAAGVLNTAVSVPYYVGLLRAMWRRTDENAEPTRPERFSTWAFCAVMAAAVIAASVMWGAVVARTAVGP
jgi:NADH-quinone oxidoreductase subunit N